MRMQVVFHKQLVTHWLQNSSTSSTASFSSKTYCRMIIIFLAPMVITVTWIRKTWLIWPLLIMPQEIECRTKPSWIIVVASSNRTHNLEPLTNTQTNSDQCLHQIVSKSTSTILILRQIQINSLLATSLPNQCKKLTKMKQAISINQQRKIRIHHNSCRKGNYKTHKTNTY